MHKARRFSEEQLDEIVKETIELQNNLLAGDSLGEALVKAGADVMVDESQILVGGTPEDPEIYEQPGGMTIKAEGKAFDAYLTWPTA